MSLTQKVMTVDDWIKIEGNPQQRDTISRARRAVKNHLSEPHDTHSRVAAAILPSGKLIKLDGHTRSYLWETLLLDRPQKLFVDVYKVKDIQEAINIYETFDNIEAVETSGDKLSGAFRLYGVPHDSKIWVKGGTTTALKSIYSNRMKGWSRIDIKKCMKPFIKELSFIDSCGFDKVNFPAPVFAAMLMSIKRDGNAALSFWEAYDNDEGKKTPKSMDSVYCLTSKIRDLREQGEFTRGSIRAVSICVPKLLVIYERWGKNLFKRTPKPDGNFAYYVSEYCGDVMNQLDRK